METEKRNGRHSQKNGFCEEYLSHLSPEEQKRFEENLKNKYVSGPRLSHEQIMEMLISAVNEEEINNEYQTQDNRHE